MKPQLLLTGLHVWNKLFFPQKDNLVETNEISPEEEEVKVEDESTKTENVEEAVTTEDEIINAEENVAAVEKPLKKEVKNEKKPDFIDLYEAGKKSYLANDFKKCIENIEEALKSYSVYTGAILKCKMGCKKESEDNFVPISTGSFRFQNNLTIKSNKIYQKLTNV